MDIFLLIEFQLQKIKKKTIIETFRYLLAHISTDTTEHSLNQPLNVHYLSHNLHWTLYNIKWNMEILTSFFVFSFHEHGKYDVPAMVDKVLNITGLEKIMYVGHSMGTTSFFTMMALKPQYNDKIISFIALAPAVYMDNMRALSNLLLKTFNLPVSFF